jgi:hypothetical protein
LLRRISQECPIPPATLPKSVTIARHTEKSREFLRRLETERLEDHTLLSVLFTPGLLTGPVHPPEASLGMAGTLVEPALSVSPGDPGNIGVSSQGQIRVSTNTGAGFTQPTGFPLNSGGDTPTAYDLAGGLSWVNLTDAGVGISQVNRTTGSVIPGDHFQGN